MMNNIDTPSPWDAKSKRSSALLSVLKWFGGKDSHTSSSVPPSDLIHSPSSSCDSIESVFSTDTVASFAFVPPTSYKPFGTASQAEKYILPGPETGTYRERLAQREARRERDKNLTLRSKYNLYNLSTEDDRGHNSLPLMTRHIAVDEDTSVMMHRRTASESSKVRKAGAYCHVKGKRKAPQPPAGKSENTLRRKKRLAPQPPNTSDDIISNDSLKLDHGILKSAKDVLSNLNQSDSAHHNNVAPQVTPTPRPWYKRTLSKSSSHDKVKDMEKEHNKRKSGMSFLTNISELDREAMEIINKENLKQKYLKNANSSQAPAFMRPRNEHIRTNSDSLVSPKRKSARDLIAKFNAITKPGTSQNKEAKERSPSIQESPKEFNIPIIQEKIESPKSPVTTRTTAVVKPISRSQWYCPKCTLENDYWRIICKVCSTIKPYFDDFTTPASPTRIDVPKNKIPGTNSVVKKDLNDFFDLCSTELRISELQRSILNSHYPKLSQLTSNNETQKDNTQNRIETVYHFQEEPTKLYPNLDIGNASLEKDKKIEQIILGDEISFTEPVEKGEIVFKTEGIKDKNKVEKMILGDEISVEKPEYINVNKYEPVSTKDENSTEEIKKDKVERMILGDEISVEKFGQVNVMNKSGKSKLITDEEKKNSAKKEETEKLKKMLIEMKNSLPKRIIKPDNIETKQRRVSLIQEQTETAENLEIDFESCAAVHDEKQLNNNSQTNIDDDEDVDEKTIELIVATTETVYENIKVKKQDPEEEIKPIKISSSAQTNAVFRRSLTLEEKEVIENSPNGFQLIGAKDFVGITNKKTEKNHIYSNVNNTEEKDTKIITSEILEPSAGPSKTDTLQINKLLRNLETSIATGQLGQAAVLARELAQLKVPLNVIRQRSNDAEGQKKNAPNFSVDMYVEDKISHRGPFPLQVTAVMSVAELKTLVEEKYKIPRDVQRWILGKELATNDCATLEDHQISTTGCPIFLYLVAPSSDKKLDIATVPEITEIQENEEPKTSWPVNKVYNVPIAIIEEDIETDISDDDEESLVKELVKNFDENAEDLWKCKACTLLNPVATRECEVCGLIRDEKEEMKENQTYQQLVNLDNEDLVPNVEGFECLVCLTNCLPGQGVTLRECLHQFCKTCLANTVEFNDEAEVKCPYRDEDYACDIALQDREVKALVTPHIYEQHLAKSVKQAENKMDNTFHCKTPDCKGWCIYEDNVNDFYCPVCRKGNCLTCQAIHIGMNCKQYQEIMRSRSDTDDDAKRTRDFLEEMMQKGEALACPTCQVVLLKKWGCDWVRCSMCKTEICWVTKGPRWGAGGKGDITGGCKCGVNGVKCHPKCNYCH